MFPYVLYGYTIVPHESILDSHGYLMVPCGCTDGLQLYMAIYIWLLTMMSPGRIVIPAFVTL